MKGSSNLRLALTTISKKTYLKTTGFHGRSRGMTTKKLCLEKHKTMRLGALLQNLIKPETI
jgi:hypothetical protein